MKKYLLCYLLLFLCLTFDAQSENIKYTKQEVYNNAIYYLNVVFGTNEPTLYDYMKFEGIDQGYEAQLTLLTCSKLFPGKDPSNSEECGKYINYRYDHKDEVISIYYDYIRKKLAISPSLIQKAEINVIEPVSDANAYRVVVDLPSFGQLVIGHALNHDTSELGLIGVVEVNGEPISKVINIP
jgi:hypothetical protein